jgi:4-hydroxythreonine-4-phosphate dehydrogenase
MAISVGDVTGIGPEVTLKALAQQASADEARYVLIGDRRCLEDLNARLGTGLPLKPYPGRSPAERFVILETTPTQLAQDLKPGAAEAARAAVDWVRTGATLCLRGEAGGLVTAPVNKEAIVRAGVPFVGQTELLSEIAKTDRTAMMLLGEDDRGRWLRVVLATTHVPLKEVSAQLTHDKVELAIERAAQACRDLRLPRARIAVCGLNPHAGEGGKMGTEEQTVIAPAVEAARRRGFDAAGPFSADALFHSVYRGDYEAVVAMYHDQGLAPLKMVAFEQGVNWTLGLPFVRTSPDHGTAYDIAGRGEASPSSMVAALRLAKALAQS